MLPIIITPQFVSALVMGKGSATARRLQMLEESHVKNIKYFENFISEKHLEESLEGVNIVYIADFNNETSATIAKIIRAKNILLNIEDKSEFCDFHVPAIIHRGDLLLTASTAGKSPRVARRIKKILENQFDNSFAEKLDVISQKRLEWKSKNTTFEEVAEKTDEEILKIGLFDNICERCRS